MSCGKMVVDWNPNNERESAFCKPASYYILTTYQTIHSNCTSIKSSCPSPEQEGGRRAGAEAEEGDSHRGQLHPQWKRHNCQVLLGWFLLHIDSVKRNMGSSLFGICSGEVLTCPWPRRCRTTGASSRGTSSTRRRRERSPRRSPPDHCRAT